MELIHWKMGVNIGRTESARVHPIHSSPLCGDPMNTPHELSTAFLENRHKLMAFILGMVRNHAAAEDIFQNVWVKVAEASARGVEIHELWCRGVARNLILHYWREQRGGRVVFSDRMVDLTEQAFAEDTADAEELWIARLSAVDHCIEQLPERSRELLRMKYEEGLRIAEIAPRLQKSVANIKVLLLRLRGALFACVEKRLPAMEGGS